MSITLRNNERFKFQSDNFPLQMLHEMIETLQGKICGMRLIIDEIDELSH